MELGIRGEASLVVNGSNTAQAMKSGLLPVFATPMMVALMEDAAAKSVQPYLKDGQTTVGTLVNVKHLSATPEGVAVSAQSELIEIDGRRLVFSVSARDASGPIGEGTHERFIVDAARFMEKTKAKKQAEQ
ncbi:MAG: thioesterase family protein [Clostridiaceae bacterium]|nr:thioesterase family protein [Eubacteriales bacterium]